MNRPGYLTNKPTGFCDTGTKWPHVRAIAARPVPSLPDQTQNPTFHTKNLEGKDNVNTLFLRAFLVTRGEIA